LEAGKDVANFGGSGEFRGQWDDGAMGRFDGLAVGDLDGWAGGGMADASAIGCSGRSQVMAGGSGIDDGRMIGQIVGWWDCSIGSY
jgi:hypothetical protein